MTQWGSGWPADQGSFGSFGAAAAAPEPPQPPSRSPWPLVALVVGVCALALACVPGGIGFAAIPVGIVGLVAGAIGAKRGGNVGLAVGGIVTSVLAMALAVALFFLVYHVSKPEQAAPVRTPTSVTSGPATVIPDENTDTELVLREEMDVSFGPYHDDGGDPDAQNPVAEMTIVSKRDITRTCNFQVRGVDSTGAEVINLYGNLMTLRPRTTARVNVFHDDKLARAKADRLRDGTFEVTKARCS